MFRISKVFFRSSYVKNVALLTSGTALAQIIPIAASPILTRMYSPEEFGIVATYTACVYILAVIATGRFELAIPLPQNDLEAANLLSLSIKLCAAFCLIMVFVISLAGQYLSEFFGLRGIESWIKFLPLSVFAIGSISALQFWCNRRSQYRRMSTNRLQQSALTTASSLAMGWQKVPGGQVFASILGQVFSFGWIGRLVWKENKDVFVNTDWAKQRELIKTYRKHPMHLVPSHLIGVTAHQIPIFLMTNAFSLAVAGYFSLAFRLVSMPSNMIANAIGDVYRQKIAVAYIETGEFRRIFLQAIGASALFAFIPFVFLYFAGPWLFSVVFGEAWRIAGEYIRILVVSSFFQFVFTPIDKGALVVGATGYIFVWHLVRLFSLAALYISTILLDLSIEKALWGLVAVNVSLYIVEGIAGYRFACGRKK